MDNIRLIWDWCDIGIMFRIYKNTRFVNYRISIDIQILWLNIWIQIYKRK